MAPVLVALGHTGFFFEMEFPLAAAVVLAGALIAGVMLGQRMATRAVYVVAFIVMGAGITAATMWYTADRSTILNYEVLIPLGVGCVPGLLLYFGFKRLLDAPRAT